MKNIDASAIPKQAVQIATMTNQHKNKLFRPTMLAALFAAGVSGPAFSLGLGEAKVQSFIGEHLIVDIPVLGRSESGELRIGCFKPIVSAPDDAADVPRVNTLTIESPGKAGTVIDRIVVRSRGAITEPAVKIGVEIGCGVELRREYFLLLSPREFELAHDLRPARREEQASTERPAAAPESAPAKVEPEPTSLVASPDRRFVELSPRAGETLRALAERLYPGDSARQERFLAMLRRMNPGTLSGQDADQPLDPSQSLRIYNERYRGRTRAVTAAPKASESPRAMVADKADKGVSPVRSDPQMVSSSAEKTQKPPSTLTPKPPKATVPGSDRLVIQSTLPATGQVPVPATGDRMPPVTERMETAKKDIEGIKGDLGKRDQRDQSILQSMQTVEVQMVVLQKQIEELKQQLAFRDQLAKQLAASATAGDVPIGPVPAQPSQMVAPTVTAAVPQHGLSDVLPIWAQILLLALIGALSGVLSYSLMKRFGKS